MNVKSLRLIIKDLVPIPLPASGKKFLFNEAVKLKLPSTNYRLLGENLCINRDEGTGKCDLWLANPKNKFLVSLDLKVGEIDDLTKQQLLVKQVNKYTGFMKCYYPMHIVYGLGAYKYPDGVNFIDTLCGDPKHIFEINKLKSVIKSS